ncbi:hypothetical protein [Nonomuraea sp. NPDC049709]|uniref:hypothetical protein n=1 Tax=Nonomuraea sp. NPDC049709 TaxID=3154736 RepID=UPI003421C775
MWSRRELSYVPGGEGDHYLVALAVERDTVVLHDPHGHPCATLPTADFLAAWRADAVKYLDTSYVMRTGFVRARRTSVPRALRASLPAAVRWLAGRDDLPVPPGTLGGAAAALRLGELVEAGLDEAVRGMLVHFGVRVGARRLADAATCLQNLGLPAAATAADQARLLGALQHPLVTGDDPAVAVTLRRLAPGYDRLRTTLTASGAIPS